MFSYFLLDENTEKGGKGEAEKPSSPKEISSKPTSPTGNKDKKTNGSQKKKNSKRKKDKGKDTKSEADNIKTEDIGASGGKDEEGKEDTEHMPTGYVAVRESKTDEATPRMKQAETAAIVLAKPPTRADKVPQSELVEVTAKQAAPADTTPDDCKPVELMSDEPNQDNTKQVEASTGEPNSGDAALEEPKPVETTPSEPDSFDTKSDDPKLVETTPSQPEYFDTKSDEPKPVESAPNEPESFHTKSDEPRPVETTPSQPESFDAKSDEPKPVESTPSQPESSDTKSDEPKPVESTPSQPESSDTKSDEPKPVESTPSQPESFDTKSDEPKPVETIADEPQPAEVAQDESQAAETTQDESERVEVLQESKPAGTTVSEFKGEQQQETAQRAETLTGEKCTDGPQSDEARTVESAPEDAQPPPDGAEPQPDDAGPDKSKEEDAQAQTDGADKNSVQPDTDVNVGGQFENVGSATLGQVEIKTESPDVPQEKSPDNTDRCEGSAREPDQAFVRAERTATADGETKASDESSKEDEEPKCQQEEESKSTEETDTEVNWTTTQIQESQEEKLEESVPSPAADSMTVSTEPEKHVQDETEQLRGKTETDATEVKAKDVEGIAEGVVEDAVVAQVQASVETGRSPLAEADKEMTEPQPAQVEEEAGQPKPNPLDTETIQPQQTHLETNASQPESVHLDSESSQPSPVEEIVQQHVVTLAEAVPVAKVDSDSASDKPKEVTKDEINSSTTEDTGTDENTKTIETEASSEETMQQEPLVAETRPAPSEESTSPPLSPAQLKAAEKERKAAKKREEKERAKQEKDEKKRLKEQKKQEAKEKKQKEKEEKEQKQLEARGKSTVASTTTTAASPEEATEKEIVEEVVSASQAVVAESMPQSTPGENNTQEAVSAESATNIEAEASAPAVPSVDKDNEDGSSLLKSVEAHVEINVAAQAELSKTDVPDSHDAKEDTDRSDPDCSSASPSIMSSPTSPVSPLSQPQSPDPAVLGTSVPDNLVSVEVNGTEQPEVLEKKEPEPCSRTDTLGKPSNEGEDEKRVSVTQPSLVSKLTPPPRKQRPRRPVEVAWKPFAEFSKRPRSGKACSFKETRPTPEECSRVARSSSSCVASTPSRQEHRNAESLTLDKTEEDPSPQQPALASPETGESVEDKTPSSETSETCNSVPANEEASVTSSQTAEVTVQQDTDQLQVREDSVAEAELSVTCISPSLSAATEPPPQTADDTDTTTRVQTDTEYEVMVEQPSRESRASINADPGSPTLVSFASIVLSGQAEAGDSLPSADRPDCQSAALQGDDQEGDAGDTTDVQTGAGDSALQSMAERLVSDANDAALEAVTRSPGKSGTAAVETAVVSPNKEEAVDDSRANVLSGTDADNCSTEEEVSAQCDTEESGHRNAEDTEVKGEDNEKTDASLETDSVHTENPEIQNDATDNEAAVCEKLDDSSVLSSPVCSVGLDHSSSDVIASVTESSLSDVAGAETNVCSKASKGPDNSDVLETSLEASSSARDETNNSDNREEEDHQNSAQSVDNSGDTEQGEKIHVNVESSEVENPVREQDALETVDKASLLASQSENILEEIAGSSPDFTETEENTSGTNVERSGCLQNEMNTEGEDNLGDTQSEEMPCPKETTDDSLDSTAKEEETPGTRTEDTSDNVDSDSRQLGDNANTEQQTIDVEKAEAKTCDTETEEQGTSAQQDTEPVDQCSAPQVNSDEHVPTSEPLPTQVLEEAETKDIQLQDVSEECSTSVVANTSMKDSQSSEKEAEITDKTTAGNAVEQLDNDCPGNSAAQPSEGLPQLSPQEASTANDKDTPDCKQEPSEGQDSTEKCLASSDADTEPPSTEATVPSEDGERVVKAGETESNREGKEERKDKAETPVSCNGSHVSGSDSNDTIDAYLRLQQDGMAAAATKSVAAEAAKETGE